ncbi:hypothetical protein, partial [Parachlamydia acanthamoebae]
MKILLTLITTFIPIFGNCLWELKPSADKFVGQILQASANLIKQKFHLHPCGTIIAMPDGVVKELGLCFTTHEKLSEEQLRSLVIDCATELLNQI